jgi:hypothetical protein
LYELHEFQPRYPTLISKKVLRRELKVIQLMQVMQANAAGSKDLIRSILAPRRQTGKFCRKSSKSTATAGHYGEIRLSGPGFMPQAG